MSYDNFAHTFSESRKDHPWKELDSIIADIAQQGYTSILDIGCGNGRFLEESAKKSLGFHDYLGLDSSRGMVEEAQKIHESHAFEIRDMRELEALSVKYPLRFGAILLLASFHHLETREDRTAVLTSTKKLLAPGGRIYMTNWNLLGQKRYEKSHRGNGDFDIKIGAFSRYYHGFTLSELAYIFEAAGCEVVEHRIFEGERNIMSILC